MANEHAATTTLQSPLGRVRGLGSARGGTHHWWMQRVTSVALLPLTLWFALSAASLAGAPYEATIGPGSPGPGTRCCCWRRSGWPSTTPRPACRW